ncbi:hypothetical protein K6H11_001415 [Candida tropicalis]
MSGLRPEFTKDLIGLIDTELNNLKREDNLKIQKLEEEIKHLKEIINLKDEEIAVLKSRRNDQKSPIKKSDLEISPIKKRVSLTGSKQIQKLLNDDEKLKEFDPRLTKSMYVSVHDLPTQYSSSSEDEDYDINKDSLSPKKSNILFSSQGSSRISPKRKLYYNTKTKDLSPLKKIPRLDNGKKMYPPPFPKLAQEVEVSRSTEEQEEEEEEEEEESGSQLKKNSQLKSTNIHELPTQYSQSSDSVFQKEIMDYLKSSPTKESINNVIFSSPTKPKTNQGKQEQEKEQEEIIEDSQEEIEDLIPNTPSQLMMPPPRTTTSGSGSLPLIEIPPDCNTVILQRKYRLQFYIDKFKNDVNFKINFKKHPTKMIKWDFGDFIPNSNHQLDEQMKFIKKNNIKNEVKYEKFIKIFGDKPEVQKFGKFEDVLSQLFDKFQSPPGFMKSEFPDTQEQIKRKEIIQQRQERRIFRRIYESTKTNDQGLQIGEFIFAIDIFNKYVINDRYFIE